MRGSEKEEATPKLVGDEFLDGFLWGRGRFGQTKKTTRGWVNISHQPIGIIYNIMERLDKYANFEVVEEHRTQKGKITEVMDIHFNQPIPSPGSLRRRDLSSEWKPEFLRGVLYARGVPLGEGNVIHLSHQKWVDELAAICARFDIPHKKYENAVAVTSEGMHHKFFREWVRASREEQDDEFYFDEEELDSIDISKDTGSVCSHYDIRVGLNGNISEKVGAIRGIADGRSFWFRPELISLIDDDDPEVRLEARISLVYTGTNQDIRNINKKHQQDVTDNFQELLNSVGSKGGMSHHTAKNKRIITRIWELDRILSINQTDQPFKMVLLAFQCFYNNETGKEDIKSSPAVKYYSLFTSYCEIDDTNVKEFVLSRLEDMLLDQSLIEFHNTISTILDNNIEED